MASITVIVIFLISLMGCQSLPNDDLQNKEWTEPNVSQATNWINWIMNTVFEKFVLYDIKLEDINNNLKSNEERFQEQALENRKLKDDIFILTNITEELEIKIVDTIEWKNNLMRRFSKDSKDCSELLEWGDVQSGVRTLHLGNSLEVEAYCDQKDSGGWTVIQRREELEVREDFFRNWADYEVGFGNRTGEYWLGLKAIHALTASRPMELMIRMEDSHGNKAYANYKTFSVADADQKYRLTVGGFEGNVRDSLEDHNGMMFTTKDNANSNYGGDNCAIYMKGAWWYTNCAASNLNGPPVYDGVAGSIFWTGFPSLQITVMMVRPL